MRDVDGHRRAAPAGVRALAAYRGLASNRPLAKLLGGEFVSATVSARTDGLVLALDGPTFLAMVSGAASIRGRLLNLYGPSPAATIAVQ
jgi:hypothetical protein